MTIKELSEDADKIHDDLFDKLKTDADNAFLSEALEAMRKVIYALSTAAKLEEE